ncbi:hypothetical protein J7E50_23860 [Pedobacter sp. ISL-68]|uniref:hypothetical protein n=1 Tax=unclassified Pedobacter TaxID=2628915 RepID=UPI001BE87DDE|nr:MULTISPECIES: hypothetical protein [unclassified Pedobacter]MBT2560543.1 hypothetical protein [Pedobacter sp. ISL-64]MBT2593276.1 hypothetical protein [Pedobacter sp. ISL-68]
MLSFKLGLKDFSTAVEMTIPLEKFLHPIIRHFERSNQSVRHFEQSAAQSRNLLKMLSFKLGLKDFSTTVEMTIPLERFLHPIIRHFERSNQSVRHFEQSAAQSRNL